MASRLGSGDTGSYSRISDTDQLEFHDTNGTQNGPRSKTLLTLWRRGAQRVGLTDLSRQGWRAGVRCAAALSAFVLLLNISVIVVAYTHPVRQQSGESFGPLVIGDCERIKRIGTWIHLGINVLSSLVLGGSNYCLQCLSAPTRTEVDKAHSEGFWLHIGVPNFRNFRTSGHRKFWVWVILSLSSIPFHLLYNSTFYTSTTTYSYDIYFADEDFATGAYVDEDLFSLSHRNVTVRLPNGTISETENYGRYSTNVHEIRDLVIEGENGPFERLDKDECIRKYANPLLTDRRNLILVASNSPLDNLTFIGDLSDVDSSYDDLLCPAHPPRPVVCGPQDSQAIMTGSLDLVTCSNSSLYAVRSWKRPYAGNWDADYFQWICSQNGSALALETSVSCGGLSNCTAEAAWDKYHGAQQWIVAGFDIDHCLSEKMEGECALNVGLPLLLTVVVFNVVKLLAIIATIWTIKENPLITVGDAVSSFIGRRDVTTGGICLWSWKEVVRRRNPPSHRASSDSCHADNSTTVMEILTIGDGNSDLIRYTPVKFPSSFSNVRQRRYKAVGTGRWVLASFLMITAFLVIIVLFSYTMSVLGRRGNVQSIWRMWIGTVLPETLISGWSVATSRNAAIVETVLIANLPQLLLTFLYFVLNSLFTSMSLATEWSHYGQHRRGLRVSQRRSQDQRSTYFLQLPYRLSIPLLCLSVLLHWIVSQTIFFVQIKGKDAVGKSVQLDNTSNDPDVITCGYSPLGMVITLVILVALMGFAIALGLRQLAPGIPMAGSCSMAIAAACHVPEGTSELLPMKWGVVSEGLFGDGEIIGHCSFSNDEVDSPTAGKMYA